MYFIYASTLFTQSHNPIKKWNQGFLKWAVLHNIPEWSVFIVHVLFIPSWCWESSDGCNPLDFIPRTTVFHSLSALTSSGPRPLLLWLSKLSKSLVWNTLRKRTLNGRGQRNLRITLQFVSHPLHASLFISGWYVWSLMTYLWIWDLNSFAQRCLQIYSLID